VNDVNVLVQARFGSSRLPGKVLLPLAGKAALARVVERCAAAAGVSRVIVATTEAAEDDGVDACARASGAEVYRGAAEDVLGRLGTAAQAFPAGHYARVTADCPLVDPGIIGDVVAAHVAGGYDFSYNDVPADYPRGYDVEVLTAELLSWLAARCRDAASREHVTPYVYAHRDEFRVYQSPPARAGVDLSRYRLVLDEPLDYELLRRLFDILGGKPLFGLDDVLACLEANPALAAINRDVAQREPPPRPATEK
jgi:spore coat polysaccharide biosynthesis protein SpsF